MTVQAPNEIDPESFEGIRGGFRLHEPIRTPAFANVALCRKQCGTNKSSMRAEPKSRTTLGIRAVIDERIVVRGDVAYLNNEMPDHSLKLPVADVYFIGWFWPTAVLRRSL
jgi:hypothetical protein